MNSSRVIEVSFPNETCIVSNYTEIPAQNQLINLDGINYRVVYRVFCPKDNKVVVVTSSI